MTPEEYRAEHRLEYETRLGMMGLEPNHNPSFEQHNAAIAIADAHITAIKRAERQTAIGPLLDLRDAL